MADSAFDCSADGYGRKAKSAVEIERTHACERAQYREIDSVPERRRVSQTMSLEEVLLVSIFPYQFTTFPPVTSLALSLHA